LLELFNHASAADNPKPTKAVNHSDSRSHKHICVGVYKYMHTAHIYLYTFIRKVIKLFIAAL